jgi:flagellar protein FlaG
MAIELISTQNKTTIPPVPGVLNTGSEDVSARTKPPAAGNGVVQMFPVGRKPEADESKRSAEQVSAMVEDLQASLEMLQQKNTQLNFSVHEKTDRIMVRITDQDTGDVIREIPSEEFLNLAAKLQEMVGLMFDMKV